MKVSAKDIGRHINTVWRQLEVARYLCGCEVNGHLKADFVNEFLFNQEGEEQQVTTKQRCMPTMFDSMEHRTRLVVLILVGGENVSDGFELAQT